MKYLELSGFFNDRTSLREVSKKELLERAGSNASVCAALTGKGILETYQYEV